MNDWHYKLELAALLLLCAGCTSEVTFSVPDMMCEESCAVKVREVLSEQPGVEQVQVDFPSRTATVLANRLRFDADAAVAALVDHGFDEARVGSASSVPTQAAGATEPAQPPATGETSSTSASSAGR
jgi:copper chaperone CopZ